MTDKTCIMCHRAKDRSEYYIHKQMSDGLLGRCKECHKAAITRNRRLNGERIKEYDRARAKTPKRKALARAGVIKWRRENPIAYKAQTKVGNALRDGKIKRQPCFVCQETKNIHAHHQDYSKPLKVIWLCAACHQAMHGASDAFEGVNKR